MKLQLQQQAKWSGKAVVVPAFPGKMSGPKSGWNQVGGVDVGKEEGELTAIRDGDAFVVLLSLGEKKKARLETFRTAGGRAVQWLSSRKLTRGAIDCRSAADFDGPAAVAALAEGAVLGGFGFSEHKSEPNARPIQAVQLLTAGADAATRKAVQRAGDVAEAANLAREIAHQPPNVINPVSLAARVKKLCQGTGLKCTVLDEKELKRRQMGGILAVGQGSDSPPRLIVIEYGAERRGKPVVLVGKAITFDTGGYSIKTKDGILGMKYDKCGGMAVIGAMKAAAALKPRCPVVGIIAAAENMISGGAYRPDDIITTMSGKTVEIVSADAEGRMVLCDALTYAQKQYNPRAVIDLATLTGGVVVALGSIRAGIFSNNDALREKLVEAGDKTHERLWPLPVDDEYLELLKGIDSDLRNSGSREAHPVQGAIFLKQFVNEKTPWAHLDIAGVADTERDLPYCPKGATGFGVRLLAEYLDAIG